MYHLREKYILTRKVNETPQQVERMKEGKTKGSFHTFYDIWKEIITKKIRGYTFS
jgi:hypothetical protein